MEMQLAKNYDAIVVGGGIAGLGVAALLQRSGMRTLCIEKNGQTGGRMRSFNIGNAWQLDLGLHLVELGDDSSCAELVGKAGKEVIWSRFTEGLDIFQDGRWLTLKHLTASCPQDISKVLNRIATMDDQDIASADTTNWHEWLEENALSKPAKDLFAISGMIMTTLSDPKEMAAGEILYISRENLRKKWNFLTAAYPVGGMRGIIKPLQEAFEETGGTLILSTEVDSVLFNDVAAKGVSINRMNLSPYPDPFQVNGFYTINAPVVVCAVPLWDLGKIISLDHTSSMPEWWIKRYQDLKSESTGVLGYTVGLKDASYDRPQFLCSGKLPNSGLPFQGFFPSALDPTVTQNGKSLLQTACVLEVRRIYDKPEANRLLEVIWKDIQEMFPDIDDKVEWKFPYKCAGCDGLARRPGQVGVFKPEVTAPEVDGLYFAGDCFRGRGLAMNSAALSAMNCAEMVLQDHGRKPVFL